MNKLLILSALLSTTVFAQVVPQGTPNFVEDYMLPCEADSGACLDIFELQLNTQLNDGFYYVCSDTKEDFKFTIASVESLLNWTAPIVAEWTEADQAICDDTCHP